MRLNVIGSKLYDGQEFGFRIKPNSQVAILGCEILPIAAILKCPETFKVDYRSSYLQGHN